MFMLSYCIIVYYVCIYIYIYIVLDLPPTLRGGQEERLLLEGDRKLRWDAMTFGSFPIR